MRIGESQSDRDPVSSVTASELQSGPQGPGKQREARPLGRVPHLWAENPGCLPSKPPWDCWPSAEQQSICFFCRCGRKSTLCYLLPLGPEMSQRKAALPSKLFPELFLLSGGSAHTGQQPDSSPDCRPGCCVPASQVPDQSKCSSSRPHCY